MSAVANAGAEEDFPGPTPDNFESGASVFRYSATASAIRRVRRMLAWPFISSGIRVIRSKEGIPAIFIYFCLDRISRAEGGIGPDVCRPLDRISGD